MNKYSVNTNYIYFIIINLNCLLICYLNMFKVILNNV